MNRSAKSNYPPDWNSHGVDDQIGTEEWWRGNGQWIRAGLAILNSQQGTPEAAALGLLQSGDGVKIMAGIRGTIMRCIVAAEMLVKVEAVFRSAIDQGGFGPENPVPQQSSALNS